MRLLAATLRFEVRDLCGIGSPAAAVPPVIYMLWHNRFFTVPAGMEPNLRPATARPSRSPAPATMATWSPAPWPSSASAPSAARPRAAAVAALVGLKRALQEGLDVCLTPDGPRGPRYELQPGVIKLAESTGAPIVPIHVRFSSAWRLKTWDRFVIPKPFSRVEVTFAEAIHLPRGMDAADL